MLGRGEDAEEALHQEAEAVARLGRPEDGRVRLRAEDELELRDQIEEQLPAAGDGLEELGLPRFERARRLGEDVADELAKGLRHGREGVLRLT